MSALGYGLAQVTVKPVRSGVGEALREPYMGMMLQSATGKDDVENGKTKFNEPVVGDTHAYGK